MYQVLKNSIATCIKFKRIALMIRQLLNNKENCVIHKKKYDNMLFKVQLSL